MWNPFKSEEKEEYRKPKGKATIIDEVPADQFPSHEEQL